MMKSNWLGGTLSGKKWPLFCLRCDHDNNLQDKNKKLFKIPLLCLEFFSQWIDQVITSGDLKKAVVSL
jgi:hypothetical protein